MMIADIQGGLVWWSWEMWLWVLSIVMFFIAGWYKGLTGGYHLGKEAVIKTLAKYMDKAMYDKDINDESDEVTMTFSKVKLSDDADEYMKDREVEDDD
jgi:hypothetical protein